jgi:urea carboxylase
MEQNKPRILIANRGEIACRIIRTCKKLEYETVAIYTSEDQYSLYVKSADVTLRLPDGPFSENYLNVDLIIKLALEINVKAVHPGYGFISENSEAARKFEESGIIWIGPTSKNISDFSTKHISKQKADDCHIPITKTSQLIKSVEECLAEAEKIKYPVMIKCSNGGGGIGMFKCETPADVKLNFPIAHQKAETIFKGSAVFLEKYISKAHHIEIQIIGDGHGNAVSIGERECSIQRRNQKVIEESPSPFLTQEIRKRICADAVRLAKHMKYKSVGTVEFIMDDETYEHYFLEVNCRLQVEHPVTEMTFGLDLVEIMIKVAFGHDFNQLIPNQLIQNGHSIEVRVYAENPLNNYSPSSGRISYLHFPEVENVRVDTAIENDSFVSPTYDPLVAKIISYGKTREEACTTLINFLSQTIIQGITTNLIFLESILKNQVYVVGRYTTKFLENFTYVSHTVEVKDPGLFSLIQDYPGRVGYWNIGVSPSGPMDKKNFKIANWLVNNKHHEAGLEILLDGIELIFHCGTYIAIAGAESEIYINNQKRNMYESLYVAPNSEVRIKLNSSKGCRVYLAIQVGIQTVPYLGSRSTFPSGNFGGLHGQALRIGDVLPLAKYEHVNPDRKWPQELRPKLTNEWVIYALGGPHGAPDYLTYEDIKTMWNHIYKVNHNANRLGIRLEGFIPQWTRSDGGDAGLHPSNVHDYAYGVGAVNFSGNIPIILTVDGPSLGGFVCPISIIESEIWKVGQVRPGDSIKFVEVDYNYAIQSLKYESSLFEGNFLANNLVVPYVEPNTINPIFRKLESGGRTIYFRMSRDCYVLVDIHLETFTIENRFVLQHVVQELQSMNLDFISEIVPGVSSLLIKYGSLKISAYELADLVTEILNSEKGKNVDDLVIKCRKVKLPLVFRDKWCKDAMERYIKTVRKEAPYLPDNCEFVRKINNLDSLEALAKIISDTTYLILGLGDVYLGAPCAVPYDPRHRIVTTRYNPARTFTPEGAVGIGGIYMCIYGMDSPGGYQLVGRSIPIWSTYNNPPWLLDFFDHVSFYLCSDEELLKIRDDYKLNKYKPEISNTTISLKEYKKFLNDNRTSIEEYQKINNIKSISERVDWSTMKDADHSVVEKNDEEMDLSNCFRLKSNVYGNLYEIKIKEGEEIKAGQSIMLIEVMKMSIYINSPIDGTVKKIIAHQGKIVKPGEVLVAIKQI